MVVKAPVSEAAADTVMVPVTGAVVDSVLVPVVAVSDFLSELHPEATKPRVSRIATVMVRDLRTLRCLRRGGSDRLFELDQARSRPGDLDHDVGGLHRGGGQVARLQVSSSAASRVISDTSRCGGAWISTSAVILSRSTRVTMPVKRLRADCDMTESGS